MRRVYLRKSSIEEGMVLGYWIWGMELAVSIYNYPTFFLDRSILWDSRESLLELKPGIKQIGGKN